MVANPFKKNQSGTVRVKPDFLSEEGTKAFFSELNAAIGAGTGRVVLDLAEMDLTSRSKEASRFCSHLAMTMLQWQKEGGNGEDWVDFVLCNYAYRRTYVLIDSYSLMQNAFFGGRMSPEEAEKAEFFRLYLESDNDIMTVGRLGNRMEIIFSGSDMGRFGNVRSGGEIEKVVAEFADDSVDSVHIDFRLTNLAKRGFLEDVKWLKRVLSEAKMRISVSFPDSEKGELPSIVDELREYF